MPNNRLRSAIGREGVEEAMMPYLIAKLSGP
jgi:hypothetical protein